MSETKTDPYNWWRGAIVGRPGPIHDGEAQDGFYKRRFRDGTEVPVAIFHDGGEQIAVQGVGQTAKKVDPVQVWSWVAKTPIPHATYKFYEERGVWPDEPPPKLTNLSEDPYEALQQELAGEIEQAQEFLKNPITTKDDADKAGVWAKRLADIARRATAFHTTEKRPVLDEGKRIDDKWRDLRETPTTWATKLKRHLDEWLRAEAKREKERAAEAAKEAARLAAEAAAKEAEARQAQQVAAITSDDRDLGEAAVVREEAEDLAQRAREARKASVPQAPKVGRVGARVSLRTFYSAEITDYDALLEHVKNDVAVKEVVQAIANGAAKENRVLPGMKIVEEQRAV